jgi:hypothetical protein
MKNEYKAGGIILYAKETRPVQKHKSDKMEVGERQIP